jgi:adenylate cyclase
MFGELLPCGGGKPLPLLKTKLVIGRQKCDISLGYGTVSARHCELEYKDGYWLVRDLGSHNGTRVNGKRCTTEWLMPNDILSVAQLRFQMAYTPTGDCPPRRVDDAAAGGRRNPLRPDAPAHGWEDRLLSDSTADGRGQLVPCGGGDPIPLRKDKLVIGRHPQCDLVIAGASVSGRHCELTWTAGKWHVRDLNSKNGTRVNGVCCQSEVLHPGDVLGAAERRFRIVYQPPGEEPTSRIAKGPAFAQSLLEAAGLQRWRPPAHHRERPRQTLEESE